ncbi:MAG: hypothetical protein IH918_03135 [Acidobacteria bacterium]|nr:hypothetical protein [Acidobacteriota bacterium]
MKGEGPAVEVPQAEIVEEAPPSDEQSASEPTPELVDDPVEEAPPPTEEVVEEVVAAPSSPDDETSPSVAAEVEERGPVAVEDKPEDSPTAEDHGTDNAKVAGLVSPRPSVPPTGLPDGVRTQRLLTVVKARAIQDVKPEPQDKVNTWPHLMLVEFGALLAITALLVIMAVVIHSPLLDPANFNATPNPSKAPWYFLGLQELLSYFDPQIAGVTVPTIVGIIGFMMMPFVDRNPSTRPSDRKFAILLYSIFISGAATLTIIGVLFRGRGFNFSYPWKDGIFFDDLKDWVDFE